MPSYLYVATAGGVSAPSTARLLRDWNAIWCPPPRLRPWHVTVNPVLGDRIWLVWQDQLPSFDPPLLLGGGRLLTATRARFGSDLLWSNVDAPGIRGAAQGLGYTGPTSMTFLRVEREDEASGHDDVAMPNNVYPKVYNLSPRQHPGLQQLTPEEEPLFTNIWP